MKKLFYKISAFFIAVLMLGSFVGCSLFRSTTELPPLPEPEVSISDDGVASWGKVEHAIYYAYMIGAGEEKLTDKCSVQLTEGQFIQVKAISGNDAYADSDFSAPKIYKKSAAQTTLSVPEVVIDKDGVAAWSVVKNAQYYLYVIDGGEEVKTTETSVRLENGESIRVKAASDDADYRNSDFSQAKTYVKTTVQTKLATPEVTIGEDGVAAWGAVQNAQYYVYAIDNGEEIKTTETSVRLENGESIKVKAASDAEAYKASDFSQPKTYLKNTVQTKLATPEVTIDEDGVAAWNAVQNAQYYVYVIDGGAEIRTSETSIQLTNGQSIKVKAASNAETYLNSDFSQVKTYTKTTVPPDGHTHTDANGDGTCDTCNKSVKAELSFFAVNDLHGKFMDTSNQPGLDEFTTYLKNLYKDATREEILLSSGDMWQGTVESSTNKGKLMTEWMNEVGFVSMTLGNHEYDWGAQVLTPNSQLADFPFLAINVTYNGKPVDYCRASTTVEKGGIKIGIIGAIGDCLSSISGDYTPGLKFATGSELTALVKAESTRLRTQEGCDFIVYSIHEGYGSSLSGVTSVSSGDISYYDTSLSDGYVDLVFEGHTHQSYILKDQYGVYHLQGGGENRYISRVDVSYNTVTAKYTVTPSIVGQSVYASSSLQDDPSIQTIFNKYFPTNNPYTTVLGRNTSKRDDTAICDKVAELYYQKGVEEWGSQYNIVLGGGFLKTRSPYYVYAGNVTYASLFSVLPFDNDIVLGKIKGTYLKSKFLETTNGTYHVHSTITSSQVSDSQYYYIVVDSYSSTYRSNNITEVARLKSGKYARDLLADFVSAGGWE